MARNSLCPGLRFHPTDVELVMYFLKKKVMGKKFRFEAISELNVYKYSPWDLPDKSLLGSKDLEWYFFCPKERKYSIGARTNRLTETGFWKSTGNDRAIFHKERTVGMVKTLVFHKGRSLKGERTNWVMYEYRIVDKEVADAGFLLDSYVICKVFQKSGLGPKNGAQYGAPFNEEDWDDDDEISANPSPHDVLPLPAMHDNSNSVVTGMFAPESGPSQVLPLAYEVAPPIADNGEDINFLLDMFKDDSSLPPDRNEDSKVDASFSYELFPKAGLGPKSGAQHGAPSTEEDWSAVAAKICANPLPSNGLPPATLPDNNGSVVTSMIISGSPYVPHFSEPNQSQDLPSAYEESPPVPFDEDDIIFLLDILKDNG